MALLTLLEAEHPDIITTFSLGSLRTDLAAAQKELADLRKKKTRTAADEARLVTLEGLSGQNWETFIWNYAAPGAPLGFSDEIDSFFAQTTPARNLDYDFWIHLAVLWLFEKHQAGMSWPDAIRAYNGSGARAPPLSRCDREAGGGGEEGRGKRRRVHPGRHLEVPDAGPGRGGVRSLVRAAPHVPRAPRDSCFARRPGSQTGATLTLSRRYAARCYIVPVAFQGQTRPYATLAPIPESGGPHSGSGGALRFLTCRSLS